MKEPSLIFLNSMSDFAWEQIPDAYRDQIVDVIEATPQHEYQVLTKRPKELLRYSRRRKLPQNFWAGVSIENQDYAWRADILREIDVELRFLSLEPLLGPLSLDYEGIHWAIVGGESGKHLADPKYADRALVEKVDGKWQPRADRIDWVRQIRDDCRAANVPFFFKQWGGVRPGSCGKTLDGRTWKEFPRLPRTAISATVDESTKANDSVPADTSTGRR